MTIKTTGVSTVMLLAMGFSTPTWAQSEGMPATEPGVADVTIVDGDTVKIECVTQAEIDAMAAEDKEKLTLPVCEAGDESVDKASEEQPKEK